jgi:succinate dehydrogenase / fumarate reductase membrane anchor subunit
MKEIDFRQSLKKANHLGSAKSGVTHWWNQRFTALALSVLSLWFIILVLRLLHAAYRTAHEMVARPWNAVLLIAFFISMFWHLCLGLQVIIEDYVHTRWKEVCLLLVVKFLATLGALASVISILRISLGA